MTEREGPRIYIACLASYNAGWLHGVWMEANQTPEALTEAVQAMLADSPVRGAEEFAIHDYEGFGNARPTEYTSLADVSKLAAFLLEFGDVASAALEHFADLEEARRAASEHYAGSANTLAEWAEDYLEESGQLEALPEALRCYLDFERFGRDLEWGGDIVSVELDGTDKSQGSCRVS